MKQIFSPFLALLLLLGLLAGCKKDDKLDDTITPVANVFSPANNLFVVLDPPTNAVVTFEWEPARVGDGTVVLYEVVFDKESGDFSQPIYSVASGTNGLENKLVLTHGDLNRIASLAGIASQSRGKLKYTISASKGLNVQRSAVVRVLEVQRPAGFATLPPNLYISGAGTEAASLAQALPFKRTAPGIFEIYTRLSAGDVKLTDGTTGSPTTYYFMGQNLLQGNTGTSPTSTPKVYRIRLDFNNGSATLTEIVSVGLWFSTYNMVTVVLPYIGNGQWKVLRTPIVFFAASYGREERYKFKFTERDAAGVTTTPYYGSTIADNQRATAATPPAYFFVVPGPDNQFDYTYKFRTEADNASVDIALKMQATAPYTHEVTL